MTPKDWRIITTIVLCGFYILLGLVITGLAGNVALLLRQFSNRSGAVLVFAVLGALESGSVILLFILARRALGERIAFSAYIVWFVILSILSIGNAVFIFFGGILSASGAEG